MPARALLALVLLLAAPLGAQEPPPPAGELSALLARFKGLQGLKARFREERRLALLEAPLVDEGWLHFAPPAEGRPARLARHVDTPAPQSVVIEGGRLSTWDGKERREVALDRSPVANQLVAGFLLILAGDEPGVRRLYEVELVKEPEERWRLVLRPRAAPLKDAIVRLEFTGKELVVEKLLLVETGGDETETRFTQVDPRHAHSPEEAARVFRLPEPAAPGASRPGGRE